MKFLLARMRTTSHYEAYAFMQKESIMQTPNLNS